VRVEVGMERPEMGEWMKGLRNGLELGVIWMRWVIFLVNLSTERDYLIEYVF